MLLTDQLGFHTLSWEGPLPPSAPRRTQVSYLFSLYLHDLPLLNKRTALFGFTSYKRIQGYTGGTGPLSVCQETGEVNFDLLVKVVSTRFLLHKVTVFPSVILSASWKEL